MYSRKGINSERYSYVTDQDIDTYCIHLIKAAQELNDMINNKKLIVYLHDMCGVSRAPILLMVYLALWKS